MNHSRQGPGYAPGSSEGAFQGLNSAGGSFPEEGAGKAGASQPLMPGPGPTALSESRKKDPWNASFVKSSSERGSAAPGLPDGEEGCALGLGPATC